MNMHLLGPAFGLISCSLLGAAHFAAGRDPYRNFVTQLVFNWYDAHSPFAGVVLRRLLVA